MCLDGYTITSTCFLFSFFHHSAGLFWAAPPLEFFLRNLDFSFESFFIFELQNKNMKVVIFKVLLFHFTKIKKLTQFTLYNTKEIGLVLNPNELLHLSPILLVHRITLPILKKNSSQMHNSKQFVWPSLRSKGTLLYKCTFVLSTQTL